jgi:hypothetical protein
MAGRYRDPVTPGGPSSDLRRWRAKASPPPGLWPGRAGSGGAQGMADRPWSNRCATARPNTNAAATMASAISASKEAVLGGDRPSLLVGFLMEVPIRTPNQDGRGPRHRSSLPTTLRRKLGNFDFKTKLGPGHPRVESRLPRSFRTSFYAVSTWSGWPDSNRRPRRPKRRALARLRYIPWQVNSSCVGGRPEPGTSRKVFKWARSRCPDCPFLSRRCVLTR